MFCVLLIVVYLSLSVLFLIRTEWFKECCGNLWNQWKSLHFSIKSFALIFIAVMTVFAAVKPPAEPTAPPPGTESTPMASEVIIERTFSDSKVNDSSKDISMGDDLLDMNRDFYDSTSNIFTRVVTNTAFVWLNPPTNHVKYARWQNYGVAEDSFWVPATNWAFVYGSNLVDGVYVSSSGTLSFDVPKSSSEAHGLPDGTGIDFLAPFHSSLSIIHSDTNSCFWYAPTDTNSMLFTWSSFYLGRNITNKFSCQVELFYNGDFTYRYYFPTNIVGFTNDFVIGGQYGDEGETYFHNNFSNLVDGLRYTTDVPDPTIDTDGDGIYDIVEIYYGTDPYVANETDDSDHDGISDNDEYYTIDPATGLRLDATNYDSDGDGIPDSSDPEPFIENTTDADNDGLLDVLELVHFDSIDNGVFNTHSGDQNGNGVINRIDLLLGVNPLLSCYAVSSSHDSYVFGWSDVANATSYDVSVKQNDETVWSTNSVTST
ncbi:MAG: hypothetical protein PF692_11565, partial [Kiritimatiellae bacterium]|nr:hypothetical protein [Kiritimatiellia bacterium]